MRDAGEFTLLCFVIVAVLFPMASDSHAEDGFLVIAHRGAAGYVAEHTAAAATLAHGMGADFIEQDVVLTSDDHPLVLHDTRLGTTTDVASRFPKRKRADGSFYAIDFTLDEIKQLRANERIDLKTGQPVYPQRFPETETDLRILTLGEEIRLIQGLNKSTGRDVGLYVEIKQPAFHREQGKDISRIVLDCLAKHGYQQHEDNVYLQCFEGVETKRIRTELKSKLKLVQLIGNANFEGAELTDWDSMCTKVGLEKLAKYVDGVGPSLQRIANVKHIANAKHNESKGSVSITSLVADAHAAGLVVHPFTFRADALPAYADNFDQLMELFVGRIGVDGVFTDFPDQAIEWRRTKKAHR